MPQKCPYCSDEVKARGAKNHVRLMSGGGHGDQGSVPDSYEKDVQNSVSDDEGGDEGEVSDSSEESDSDPSVSDTEASEVTAEEIGETSPEAVPDEDDDSDYPFDPNDDDAIRLDGDETIYIRHEGEVLEADVEAGDWLLITDSGPVLYDGESGDRYEVVTA